MEKITKPCLWCEKPLETTQKRIDAGRGKYCSITCSVKAQKTEHGHCHKRGYSRTYSSWAMMKQRCSNPKATGYGIYGGRGITYPERWALFENFVEDMGERPERTTLDRIDPDGPYCLSNCRWATKDQQSNNLIGVLTVRHNGEVLTLTDLSRRYGINRATLYNRVVKGWDFEQIIGAPSGKSLSCRLAQIQ